MKQRTKNIIGFFVVVVLTAMNVVFGGNLIAQAACTPHTNTFPTSTNNYASGDCIPSAWANSLETFLGTNSSGSIPYYNNSTGFATTTNMFYDSLRNVFSFVNASGTSLSVSNFLNIASGTVSNTLQFLNYSGLPQIKGPGGTSGLHFDGPGIVTIHNSGNQTITFSSTNKVGIGTQAPNAMLEVHGTSTAATADQFRAASSSGVIDFQIYANGRASSTEFISPSSTIDNLYDASGNRYATSTATGANPTATAGTTAVNGTANTFMRSDAAPAIGTVFASSTYSVTNYDATTTGQYAYFLMMVPDFTFTFANMGCMNAAATTTYDIMTTSTSAIATSGIRIAALYCGISSTSTITFVSSTIAKGSYLIAVTSSTAGTPTRDEIWWSGYKQ